MLLVQRRRPYPIGLDETTNAHKMLWLLFFQYLSHGYGLDGRAPPTLFVYLERQQRDRNTNFLDQSQCMQSITFTYVFSLSNLFIIIVNESFYINT